MEGNSFGGFVVRRGGGSIFMSGWMNVDVTEEGKEMGEKGWWSYWMSRVVRFVEKGPGVAEMSTGKRTCDCDLGWNDPSSAPRTPMRGTPTRVRADLIQDAEASGPSAKTGRDHWKIY